MKPINDFAEDRQLSPKKKIIMEKIKVRLVAFVIGLLCGILLMFIRPWNMNGKGDNDAAISDAGKMDAVIEVEAADKGEGSVVTISYLQEMVQDASDLVSTRYFYKDADTWTNTKKWFGGKDIPLTKNENVYTYTGTISLGIDVSKIGFAVNNTAKEIEADLPDIKVIANEIDADSFEFIQTKSSIFNQLKMEDITNLISELKKAKEEKVMENKDLLDDAKDRAESIVRELIRKSDLASEYTIVFR